MSTKIYYGFKFKDCTSIDQAYDHLRNIRKKYVRKAEDEFNRTIVRIATFQYDNDAPLKNYRSYITEANFDLSDRLNKKEDVIYGDYSSEILVGKVDNIILGYYLLPREFYNTFKKESFFKEYGYWNNTDKLSNVSEKNWELRKQHWESIFDNTFYLNKNMFSFKLVELNDYIYVNDRPYKNSYIPNDDERISHLAEKLANQHFSDTFSEFIKNEQYSKMINFYRTPEYKTVLDQMKKEIVLKPVSINILKESQ